MTPCEFWFSILFSPEVEGEALSLDPNDPGNYTPDGRLLGSQCGISAKEFPTAPFGSITPSMAAGLAKPKYWDAHGLDEFVPGVAILMADTYYNGGHPILWLQAAIGTKQDNEWGKISSGLLAKLWAYNPIGVLRSYNSYRLAYLAGLHNDSQERGWARRCDIMLCAAIQASGGLPAVIFS
jgi:lysozyme family protein